jgi:hypothetical protein
MYGERIFAAALAALMVSAPAAAVTDVEFSELREQLKQLKEQYEKRVQALEQRLGEAERAAARAGQQPERAETPASTPPPPTPSAARAGPSALNPEISLILSGTYYNASQDPNKAGITGFIPPGNDFKPGTRGFSLSDTELTISGGVDPYFRAQATIGITPENAAEIEEAYFQTLSLPHGLGLKGGRYFSSIAYLNQFHPHAWDFVDAPLVYQAYWGQNLAIDGAQLAWVAPTDTYVQLGLEFGQGKNLPGEGFREKNGTGTGTLYLQIGDDIGRESSYLAGVSAFQTSNKGTDGLTVNTADPAGNAVQDTFTGTTRIAGGYFVYKWAPNRDFARSGLKLQAEYYQRWQNGDLTYDAGNTTGVGDVTGGVKRRQAGWYGQAVYKFDPHWRAGVRYDSLATLSTNLAPQLTGLVATPGYKPWRASAMVDWSLTEFSRFRLQYSYSRALEGVSDNQLFLQFIMSLGAHAAHPF